MKTAFNERLRELRVSNKMRQQDLADKLNVSKSAVSGWEVGRNQPNYDILIELSVIFDVSVDYLVGKSEY